MSDTAELLNAIAALMWVVIGLAALIIVGKLLHARSSSLSKFGLGPGGVTIEFAEAKIAQAVRGADERTQALIGQAARRSVVDRLQRNADILSRARVLWVDDHPENNEPIVQLLRQYGTVVETATSNREAFSYLSGSRYDVVVSDVSRDDEGSNSDLKGVELAKKVFERWNQPVLLFTARFNPATVPGMTLEERLALVESLNEAVFGSTFRMDEILHLILDLLDRSA
jgi:CheY-like chemotaxis protein